MAGAGLATMSTAWRLERYGHTVHVVEASNRVGSKT
ncbi:NAD(P)-binding protein [Mesorhizobium sp. PUT5]